MPFRFGLLSRLAGALQLFGDLCELLLALGPLLEKSFVGSSSIAVIALQKLCLGICAHFISPPLSLHARRFRGLALLFETLELSLETFLFRIAGGTLRQLVLLQLFD